MEVRQLYQCRRSRAKYDPSVYASMIIDGMDQVTTGVYNIYLKFENVSSLTWYVSEIFQAKTHVPYNSIEKMSQKDVQQNRLIQRVHGVILHGIGTFLYLVEPVIVPKGSNQGTLLSTLPQLSKCRINSVCVSFFHFQSSRL